MAKYLLTEDQEGKSGYTFWKTLMSELCGLNKKRLSLHDKMLQIMKNTGLQSELIFLEG